MKREEEIEKMAIQAHNDYASTGYTVEDFKEYTRDVLKWADEHPKNPWRDARKELPVEDRVYYTAGKEGRQEAFYKKESNTWIGFFGTIEPSFWMPIHELPKEKL